MEKMVFGFPTEQARNAAGRAARDAGYDCLGSNDPETELAYILTVDETAQPRRSRVSELILRAAPGANRLH